MDDEQRAFQEFERAGWESVAETYADIMSSATPQIAPALLDAAGVSRGDRVLDVATGPGFVAAAAAARGATAVGLDIADAMVAEASRRYPAIEFRQGAAESLPFGDAHFDAVVSALGMPHFADHQAFFRESHRTLRSSGRLALATWKQPDKNPFAGLVLGAIGRVGRLDSTRLPSGPDAFEFAEPERCSEVLESAGFRNVEARDLTIGIAVDGVSDILRFIESGSVRSRAIYQAQTDDARSKLPAVVAEMLAPYAQENGALVPGALTVVSARPA